MAYQATFKRYELKYLLTRQEKQNVLKSMAEHMKPVSYTHLDVYKRQRQGRNWKRKMRVCWKS